MNCKLALVLFAVFFAVIMMTANGYPHGSDDDDFMEEKRFSLRNVVEALMDKRISPHLIKSLVGRK